MAGGFLPYGRNNVEIAFANLMGIKCYNMVEVMVAWVKTRGPARATGFTNACIVK